MPITIVPFTLHEMPRFSHEEANQDVIVYLWEHHYNVAELEAMCVSANIAIEGISACCKRRIEQLSTRIMLHELLGEEGELAHDKLGRPILPHSTLHLSISHTASAFAISISCQEHGIDIERPSERALRLRTRFLSPSEQNISLGTPWNSRTESTALWCAKEAAYKLYSSEKLTHIGQIQLEYIDSFHLKVTPTSDTSRTGQVRLYTLPSLILAVCRRKCKL